MLMCADGGVCVCASAVGGKKKPQKCVNRCKCLLWTQTDTLEQSWSEDEQQEANTRARLSEAHNS